MNQLCEVWLRSECIVPIILLRSNSGASRIKSCIPKLNFEELKVSLVFLFWSLVDL